MSSDVLVIDVSKYQAQDPQGYANPKKMNWQKALDAGITGAIFRCGLGYIEDWTYQYNRSECERLAIPFGVYHVFWPGTDIERQVQFFQDRMAGSVYPACDMEVDRGVNKTTLKAWAKEYIQGVAEKRKPMIYTRATWWDEHIGTTTWAKAYPLWDAHYNLTVKQPDLPKDWKTAGWKFWQYSADGNGQGAKYGAQSTSIDLNRYNGSMEEFMSEFSIEPEEPEPEPVASGLRFTVQVPVLNIREGPGTQYRDVGDLHGGEVVAALNCGGRNSWIEIAPGKWACIQLNDNQYLVKVED